MSVFDAIAKKKRKKSNSGNILSRIIENRIEILASAMAILIAALLLGLTSDYYPAGYVTPQPAKTENVMQEEDAGISGVEKCMMENPTLLRERCEDIDYHERAIAEDDASLCESIKDDYVRSHCERYFG